MRIFNLKNKISRNRVTVSGQDSYRFKSGRFLELAIVGAFVIVLLYLLSMSVRVTTGVSSTLEAPDYTVRLQVLNGCGVNGLAARVADRLASYSDENIEIRVLDTDNFNLRTVSNSFIISRDEDTKVAELLAARLGLDPSTVIYKPLEKNFRQVSATLVLGKDWENLTLPRVVSNKSGGN